MNRFPVEVCDHIFQFACIDDGTTGRSLSLVSKYIHDISAPYKLRSIATYGVKQIEAFTALLYKTPPHLRRVVHLVISRGPLIDRLEFARDDEEIRASSSSILRTTRTVTDKLIPGIKRYRERKKLRERISRDRQCQRTHRQRDEAIYSAFLKILTTVKASLRTLAMDLESSFYPQPASIDPILLPVLTSLTINHYALWDAEQRVLLSPLATLPSLRYLDLLGFRHSYPPKLYSRIATLAPFLTHLRLPLRMAIDLECGLNQCIFHGQSEYNLCQPDALPSTMQRVFVQITRQPEFVCCADWESRTIARYRLLAEQDEKVVVLDIDDRGVDIEDLVERN